MEYIVRSPYPDVHIPDHLSITDFLFMFFERFGDRVAIVDGYTDQKFTYSELIKYSTNLAGALHRRGLDKGDTLMLVTPSVVEYPVAVFAATMLGGVVTTCNPLNTADDIYGQMEDAQVKFVVTIPMFMAKVQEAAKRHGKITHVISVGDVKGHLSFDALMKETGPEFPRPDINVQEDVACLLYSSGTTGKPKGVMLTHHNLIACACQLSCPAMKTSTEATVAIVPLPLYHIFGVLCIMGLLAGQRIILIPRFDLEGFLKVIQKYKGTQLTVVPPIVVLLAKHPLVDNYDLSSVLSITSGAAPLGHEVPSQLKERLDISGFVQGYGLTEACAVTRCNAVYSDLASSGVALPNTEIKVTDLDTGESCGPYKQGEICARGPQIMKGYLGRPEETRRTIDSEGWFHTGDIGYYDKDGLFFIVDRLKELIKYKGFQVAPASLESLLLDHPCIADVAVVGVPDLMAGELPRAYVVKKMGKVISVEDIVAFVKGNVAPHMQLRGGVHFIKEIPKSASGKILRRELRKLVQSETRTSKL